MTTINLRELYPWYTEDTFIEVSDEVAAFLEEDKRLQINYAQYIRDNKAFYSLDAGDGIEAEALNLPEQPDEVLERMELDDCYKKLWHSSRPHSGGVFLLISLKDDPSLKLRPAKVLLKAQFRKRFHADGKISGIFSKSFANTPNFCPFFLEAYERDIILARLCSLTTA